MINYRAIFVLFILCALPVQAAIEGSSWFPIGPAPGSFSAFPGGVGGRASAVTVNPSDADEIWLGHAQGGVWHSTDFGLNWTPISDKQASTAIGSLAVAGCDGSGCGWVYAGTGENAIRRDTFYGQGLLVGQSDAGSPVVWSLKKGDPYDFSYGSIYSVVLDPTTSGSGQVIYITLSVGKTASATESTDTAPEPSPGGYGIYKSLDNGNTWTKLSIDGTAGERPTDLEMDPNDEMTLYAGFLGKGIFKSSNGGSDWCPMNKGVPKPMGCPNTGMVLPNSNNVDFDHVEIALFDSDTLYASFGRCPDPLIASCVPSVYKSINGGDDWMEQLAGSESSGSGCVNAYSRYTHALAVDPADSATVFLGGVRLCKSTNSGVSWSLSDNNTMSSVTHFDHRDMIFHPVTTNRAYEVNDGGIAVSQNSGNSWTPRNEDLQTHGFQSISSSALTARVIGGLQDNSGQMWIGARAWDFLPCCGDGGFSVMDSDDAMRMYVTTNTSNPTSVIPKRSSNGGASFNDSINSGLTTSTPRSFYAPLVEDPSAPHPLYFGTNRLLKSSNDASSWSAVSPILASALSSGQAAEIVPGEDVITAIAVAPDNPNRIYIGYYSGHVFVTDAACTTPSCWPQRDSGLPSAPVTWIGVHPTLEDTAYVTFAGYFGGIHVYKTTNGGVTWVPTAAHADLNGVPVNSVIVEPGAASRVWLGTDIGIYKSHTSGGSWFKFGNGLPNAPVFEISIETSRNRVFAGTHGRGVFMITQPFLSNFEGWVGDNIWDIPVYGHGFLPNQACTMKILRQDASVCASGMQDAIGGTIETDAGGVLVTSAGGFYSGKPVAWACLNGSCLGGATIASCNQPGNEVAAVIAICGPQVGIDVMTGCPPLSNPPSSFASLTGLGGFFGPPGDGTAAAGVFSVVPTLQSGDGSTRSLCSVDVSFSSGETTLDVLERARDEINANADCIASNVSAEAIEGRNTEEIEDLFPQQDMLGLLAPALIGGELIPTLRTQPGDATGICFSLDKLGVPVVNQIRIMRARIMTAAGGASGGEVTLRERSTLGDCTIRVPTNAGDDATTIAKKLADAFQAPGIPGPNPECPSSTNPRDVNQHGDSVVVVLASALEICSEDNGVGFSLAPEELCFADSDCDDDNSCSRNTCDADGRCQSSNEPDGLSCDDADLCTSGNTCNGGVCGTPLQCDDGINCTEDSCNPEDGRCINNQIECDDGNVCTSESCDVNSGKCISTPLTGQSCDNGDLCTVESTCQEDPISGDIECLGAQACDDFNECTADYCDPVTGGCANDAISCDDGNPCTTDSCSQGLCESRPVLDIACDDGDPCTIDEKCEDPGTGSAVCNGFPIDCNDGDVCTTDVCNDATGVCENPGTQLQTVGGLTFTDKETLVWNATNATHWNTYRGTIPAGGLASRATPYDHRCFESADANNDGALTSIDLEIPAVGTGFYYDNTEETGCGEGPLGTDSDGTVRPAMNACPTPP